MILVVGGIKGGVGKTILSTNLAVLRASEGKKVLLIDTDEQRSATDWVDQRWGLNIETDWTTIQLYGTAIHTQIIKLATHYDDIIIDTAGKESFALRSALTIADKFLVPFRPKSLDVWTLGKVNTIISEVTSINHKIKCFSVLNQSDSTGTDNKDAYDVLSECHNINCIPIFIGYRKSFSSAAAQGLAVCEFKPIDKKAIQEMNSLYETIYR